MRGTSLLQIAASCALACGAGAGVVRYDFTGTVTFASQPGPFGVLAQPGNPVTGWFIYDDQTPDVDPNPFFGHYPQGVPMGYGFVINNASTATCDNYDIFITGDNPPNNSFDEMEPFSSNVILVDGVPQVSANMYVQLRDDTGTVFPADGLPDWRLTLADFPDNDNFALPNGYLLDTSTGAVVEFSIDSLVGVPSPGALALLAGAALVAVRRRRG